MNQHSLSTIFSSCPAILLNANTYAVVHCSFPSTNIKIPKHIIAAIKNINKHLKILCLVHLCFCIAILFSSSNFVALSKLISYLGVNFNLSSI